MYYATMYENANNYTLLSATINIWGNLRVTDNVIPFITSENKIGLLSNTNTFHNADTQVGVRILYR